MADGGGYRSLLLGAGVIQGLDSRDSNASTSGLLQALTYQAGLSGGSWLLSSLVSNDYPTVSYLQENLWEQAFAQSLLIPGNILELPVTEAEIIEDVLSKQVAGYDTSFTDPWGRLLSYQLFEGDDGGVADTFSGVTALSSFINYSMPFPIITALGVKTFEGECLPGPNATQYEFSPYEFGSWDEGVEAFMQIHYLGTSLSNGQPDNGTCTTNFDNQGFILGTSSTLFNEYCTVLPEAVNSSSADIYEFIAAIESEINTLTLYDEYAKYPNPFYNYNSSTLVSEQTTLHLVDGGEALQNNPIWPLIHSARDVDVLFVNDNSADTSSNFPNGSEILTTYVQSLSAGLARMPYIPSVETFIDEGLNTRATFFGCNDTSKITIIYLPNVAYTYDSGQSTSKLEYTEEETAGMISNGVAIATQNGNIGPTTNYTLSSGYEMPAIGFGVYQVPASECPALCLYALSTGYRLIDTARAYKNEGASAKALHIASRSSTTPNIPPNAWPKLSPNLELPCTPAFPSTIPRTSIFLTTKIPPGPKKGMGYTNARANINITLDDTGLDYIDLYLIHAPYGGRTARLGAWKALVEAQTEGKVRSIGVSNYGIKHLEELRKWIEACKRRVEKWEMKRTKAMQADDRTTSSTDDIEDGDDFLATDDPNTSLTPSLVLAISSSHPSVNQLELHPRLPRRSLVAYCRLHNIHLQAYSPLIRGPSQIPADFLNLLILIGVRHGNRSWAQVLIRWSLQKGFVPLVKSEHPERIEANWTGVWGWELREEEMKVLEGEDEDEERYEPTGWDPTVCED
ncbi:putative lysophospholipase 1 [Phaeomoniella chlamydospora]|uniref:Lysophospholipase n=1 Tax=Phaeomoniella chlamydospora TaxID=158046 RepID=A0A0G2EWL1_PHACM|nr:putative lysophospholipase 1 [Phaeomoniella chlamydospora]